MGGNDNRWERRRDGERRDALRVESAGCLGARLESAQRSASFAALSSNLIA